MKIHSNFSLTFKKQEDNEQQPTMSRSYTFVLPHKTLRYSTNLPLIECLADIRDKGFWDQPGEHNYTSYFYTIDPNGNYEALDVSNYQSGKIFMRFITKGSHPPHSRQSYVHVHASIACDSCGIKPIIGSRYKCMVCRDYTHCEKCELKRHHVEHEMVRMAESKIYCNECRLPAAVFGFSYKCIKCRDFYLCLACEMQHVHLKHTMTRFTLEQSITLTGEDSSEDEEYMEPHYTHDHTY